MDDKGINSKAEKSISKAEEVLKESYPGAVCEFKEGGAISGTGCTVKVTKLTAEAMITRLTMCAFHQLMIPAVRFVVRSYISLQCLVVQAFPLGCCAVKCKYWNTGALFTARPQESEWGTPKGLETGGPNSATT